MSVPAGPSGSLIFQYRLRAEIVEAAKVSLKRATAKPDGGKG